uniref:Uncharacterized protein n=1 Tax=Oryza nivara TaxID=4536 RepID=A0A0E0G4M3_ORYNI
MASKVTETAPGDLLSNGLWLAWAGCAQTNQPMCVFGVVAQGPPRLLGFSSLLLHAKGTRGGVGSVGSAS